MYIGEFEKRWIEYKIPEYFCLNELDGYTILQSTIYKWLSVVL